VTTALTVPLCAAMASMQASVSSTEEISAVFNEIDSSVAEA
jgi:hypothetical protein